MLYQLTPDRLDVFLTHDWPKGITRYGNQKELFRRKPHFKYQAMEGTLRTPAGEIVMNNLRPKHIFAAHMHLSKSKYPTEIIFIHIHKFLIR